MYIFKSLQRVNVHYPVFFCSLTSLLHPTIAPVVRYAEELRRRQGEIARLRAEITEHEQAIRSHEVQYNCPLLSMAPLSILQCHMSISPIA